MKPFIRKLHRWLGLLVSVQIIAWMASGFYFSWIPIEEIRGEHLTGSEPAPDAGQLSGLVRPERAWEAVSRAMEPPLELQDLSLHVLNGTLFYRVSGRSGGKGFVRLVHGESGNLSSSLTQDEAVTIAQSLLKEPGMLRDVTWVEEVEPGHEIRGRSLPVWRVDFTVPEKLSLYLDPWTGELLARRTTRWRVFDFLWMLHIMDFENRDDFNTPLLQIAAALGLLVALSGVVFWCMTTRLFRRRRVRAS